MRLLLAEDNQRLSDLLAEGLRDAGHVVDATSNAADFRDAARAATHDLYIIDLGLPDADGFDLIRTLRRGADRTPILVVTARGSVAERVQGLDAGADDYLVKPFSRDEFLARVRALLRRPTGLTEQLIVAGRVALCWSTAEVTCDGCVLNLRPSERRLLAILMRRRGSIVPREVIEEAIADFDSDVTPNSIEKLVSRLRKALGDTPSGLQIRTVRGIGYALEETAR